ncbi:MAG: YlbF family regulator [Erysipelotrichaceae bacterium]|jgi:cell fate (sporulation/competence/biofilm development) regulator YlbF (YheA/YmcA/DUF963 family)|nr:YlbF family regulator [Bacilli bacterium]NLV28736.1 YlbF family regulator [Erysipelotrichaceae bacterium]
MKNDLYLDTCALKEALMNDPRIIRLNDLEKKMNEDDSVMALAYQKDVASSRYSDILSIYCKEEAPEVKKAREELIEAKTTLYEHPLVREYLDVYQSVRSIYQRINNNIISLIDPDMCPKEGD